MNNLIYINEGQRGGGGGGQGKLTSTGFKGSKQLRYMG